MKPRMFVRLIGLILVAVAAVSPVAAQVLEDPVTVPVRVVAYAYLMGVNPMANPSQPVNSYAAISLGGAADSASVLIGGQVGSRTLTIQPGLVPGKSYPMAMTAQNVFQQFRVFIAPPTGYRVFVNNVEQSGLGYTNNTPGMVSVPPTADVRIENGESARPGEVSPLRPSRVVWTAGLGSLKNGSPAGVIALRQSNPTSLSASDFQVSSLIHQSASAEVLTYQGTGAATGSFQVYANQCLAQVNPLPGGSQGFTIKFYSRDQITTTLIDNQWQMTGGALPFEEYQVENTTPFAYAISAKLRITRTSRINSPGNSGATVWRTELRQNAGQPAGITQWDVIDWTTNTIDGSNNLIRGDSWTRWTYSNAANGDLNEDITVYNVASVAATVTRNVYKPFPWGSELISSTAGYGGANPLVTQYDYHTTSTAWGSYGRLKHVIDPTGKWIRYDYYEDNARLGLVQATYEPWVNAPASPTAANYNTGLVTTFDYAVDLTGVRFTRPSSIVKKVNTTTIGQTTTTYQDTAVAENVTYGGTNYSVTRYLVNATTKNYYNATQFLTSVNRSYREDAGTGLLPNGQYEVTRGFLPDLPYDATAVDGTRQAWTYTRGLRDNTFWFFNTLAEGTEWSIRKENLGPSGAVDGGSTFETNVHGYDGTMRIASQGVYAQGSWRTTRQARTFFANWCIAPYQVEINSGSAWQNSWITDTTTWNGGWVTATVDATGVRREYTYDNVGRKTSDIHKVKAAQPANLPANDIHTVLVYDGAGRVTSVRKQTSTSQSSEDLWETTTYDTAGRTTSTTQKGPNGDLTTNFSYFVSGNPRRTQATFVPTNATTISQSQLDGRPESESGTARYGGSLAKSYTYGVDGSGNT